MIHETLAPLFFQLTISMNTQLISRPLNLTYRKKNWFFLLAGLGFTGYATYKLRRSLPYTATKRRRRKRLLNLFSALFSFLEAISESAEVAGVVARDLKGYLGSQSDEIPKSLKQVSKIASSDEFRDSVARIAQAVTAGTLMGYRSSVEGRHGDRMVLIEGNSGFIDRFLDKMFSASGSGFASVVVGSFARNLVMGIHDGVKSDRVSIDRLACPDGSVLEEGVVPRWVGLMCSNRSRAVVGGWIQVFVSTAVTVYLEKTMHINTYDEFFASVTNPNHEEKVKDMVVSVSSRVVETMFRTSHEVLTRSESDTNHDSLHPNILQPKDRILDDDVSQGQSSLVVEQNGYELRPLLDEHGGQKGVDESRTSGWLSDISSTLSVPRYRKFILDVTGTVTFEAVRSILEFLLEKSLNGLRGCYNFVRDDVVNRGIGAVRYVSAKFSAAVTIFLSLCLYMLHGAWRLMPA